jgi:hypothetical protein
VSARLETSTEALANLPARPPATRGEAAPPMKPAATPAPRVYRAARANFYGLAKTHGGHSAEAYRQITPGYFQVHESEGSAAETEAGQTARKAARLKDIQAAVSYRSSLTLLPSPDGEQPVVVDVLV